MNSRSEPDVIGLVARELFRADHDEDDPILFGDISKEKRQQYERMAAVSITAMNRRIGEVIVGLDKLHEVAQEAAMGIVGNWKKLSGEDDAKKFDAIIGNIGDEITALQSKLSHDSR